MILESSITRLLRLAVLALSACGPATRPTDVGQSAEEGSSATPGRPTRTLRPLMALNELPDQSCEPAEVPSDCQSITGLGPIVPGGTGTPPDVVVTDCRVVPPGTFTFGDVNLRQGGTLIFQDAAGGTKLYARSILVEQGGTLEAGTWDHPFGCGGGKLTIGLWGGSSDSDPPISCANGACYPPDRVGDYCDGADLTDPCQSADPTLGDNAKLEAYAELHGEGYFGRKVLAVGYGGSLELFGRKGVALSQRTDPDQPGVHPRQCSIPSPDQQFDPSVWAAGSGTSWARVSADVAPKATSVTLDRTVDWSAGDQVVLTTTDWHPSHSELLTVESVNGSALTLASPASFAHEGDIFEVSEDELSHDPGHQNTQVDVRAAVGLLSRSITIRSMGPALSGGEPVEFPTADACGYDDSGAAPTSPDCYYGGHVVARQGFGRFQLRGVELVQLGQGGSMGHYPVHFHLAKDTSYTNAFVTDSAIWDSNTRFVTIHGSHEVEVARNVGYLSVGHAFYLEDGSEIGNSFCYNLGVSARAPFAEYFMAQPAGSPTRRVIPPILDAVAGASGQLDEVGIDASTPAMFWIMNADNDFVGNKAVGVHGVGVCYWPLNSKVSGPSAGMSWDGYADWNTFGRIAPLRRFRGNSCSTAAYAFMTERGSGFPSLQILEQNAQLTALHPSHEMPASALPQLSGNFPATKLAATGQLQGNCSYQTGGGLPSANLKANYDSCAVTVIDHFTTSFNWAEVNVGSVWLRPFHYLFSNSAITDQLYGGLGFVSGGSPEQALSGQLALTIDSVFVGSTAEPSDLDAAALGPSLPKECRSGQFCTSDIDGVPYFIGGFQPKRPITIYDGPFFADGNIFLVDKITQGLDDSVYGYSSQPLDQGTPHLVDAGIGWKQSNGFYYPPVFGFRDTAFKKGSQRHNVVDQYVPYSNYAQDKGGRILGGPSFTPIDTTTILNDLDGTLNGLAPASGPKRSSGLSNNHFYSAPVMVSECNSFGTLTMPYEFVSTFIAKIDTSTGKTRPDWQGAKPVVAVYRQFHLPDEQSCADVCASATEQACMRGTFFMGSSIGQAMGLTMRGGAYYIDTNTASQTAGGTCLGATNAGFQLSTFEAGNTYAVYDLFANSASAVTYQLYVGPGFEVQEDFSWLRVLPTDTGSTSYTTHKATDEGLGLPSYDAGSGVLTVTIDQSRIAGDFAFNASDPILCQPSDLCVPAAGGASSCVSRTTLAPGYEGLEALVEHVCETWVTPAYAEVEGGAEDGLYLATCPTDGCLGFAFSLPATFQPKPYGEVGQALSACYPDAFWEATLVAADADTCPLPDVNRAACP